MKNLILVVFEFAANVLNLTNDKYEAGIITFFAGILEKLF